MSNFFQAMLGDISDFLSSLFPNLVARIASLNPKQEWVMWVQLLAGAMTVVWIIIQFAAWRRLNEARVERYLEDRIDSERDDLARERAETLAQLDRVVARRGIRRTLLSAWAHVVLTISFILRMLSLDTVRGLSNHSMLLLQVGRKRRARRVYVDIAQDAMKKIKLYESALANTKLEAQNALLFAGRVAVLEDRPAAAVAAFRRVLGLRDDPDARLMVGQQLAETDPDGALQQFNAALAMPEVLGQPQTRSELLRSIAKVQISQQSLGRARRTLNRAQEVDAPLRLYLGLGKTEELRGDLYGPNERFKNAAVTAYQNSAEHYRKVPDLARAAVVERKLKQLTGGSAPTNDGWLTLWLERRANKLLKRVELRRVRLSKIEV